MTVAFIDGGCRGNPGLAAFGVYIRYQGRIVELKQVLVQPATNNVAEYCGLIAALRWARDHRANPLHVKSDSQIVVYQMQGKYQVSDRKLAVLYEEAYRLTQEIGTVTLEYIPRRFNEEADRLCNEAMDAAESACRLDGFRNAPRIRGV